MSLFPAPAPSSLSDLKSHCHFPGSLSTSYLDLWSRPCLPTNSSPDSPASCYFKTQLGQRHLQEMSVPLHPSHTGEGMRERLSNLLEITQLTRGEAKAGTQAHGVAQTLALSLGNQKTRTEAQTSRSSEAGLANLLPSGHWCSEGRTP